MAGLGQLAKLTTRGMRLEPGSGGTGGLKWDDVAEQHQPYLAYHRARLVGG